MKFGAIFAIKANVVKVSDKILAQLDQIGWYKASSNSSLYILLPWRNW